MKKSSFWTMIVLIFVCGLFFLCLKTDDTMPDKKEAVVSHSFSEAASEESMLMAWGSWAEQNLSLIHISSSMAQIQKFCCAVNNHINAFFEIEYSNF